MLDKNFFDKNKKMIVFHLAPVYISLSRMQKSHAPTKIEIYLSM